MEPEKLIYYCEFSLSEEICLIDIILISYQKTITFCNRLQLFKLWLNIFNYAT